MADVTLNVRIKSRTDTEANWKSKNPVLLKGEVGITSDNNRYKVGDGTTKWASLSYATLTWDQITGKPTTFPPSAHTHAISEINNLQTKLDGKAPAAGSTNIKTLADTITLGSGGSAMIDQNNDTYRQRIKITDNSTANDEVFGFYQSTDSGSSYTDLFSIRDDGVVVAKTFSGNLSGTATYATYAYDVLAYSGNEITLGGAANGVPTNDAVWFNYREKKGGSVSSSATKITNYHFGNRFGSTSGVTVNAATFKGSLTGNASSANYASYPQGFSSRNTSATWGNQDGTLLTDWHSSNGGDIAFRENNGQINVVTDGFFYQNEGSYRCLDTNSYSSYALPLSGGTMGGTAFISWPDTGNWSNNADVTYPVIRGGLKWTGQSDGVQIYAEETARDNLELIMKFTDDNSNGLSIRNASGTTTFRIGANGYFSGIGGTITGTITRAGGGTWISGRDNAVVRGTATGSSSFNVVASQKTPKGSWNIGNLGSNEYLAFSYDMDTNYNAGTNSATVTYLPNTGGTIALTSQIPSVYNPKITIKQADSVRGSFTLNQTDDITIELTDANSWRPVQDNLTSSSISDSLSANQGRVLNNTISTHANNKSNPHGVTKSQVGLGNVANFSQIVAVNANDYYGMAKPDGTATDWIRTTKNGLIPYQSGGKANGHSSLGTSSWYFSTAYISNIYDSTGNNIKANYVNKLAMSNDSLTYTMGDGTANKLTIGSIDKIINVALTASGWTQDTGTGRYIQSVSNSEIKATYNAICASRADSSWNTSTLKAYNKAFGIVSQGTATTTDGSCTFSVMKKPSTDITVALYCSVSADSLAADSNNAVSKNYVDNQLATYERGTYSDVTAAKNAANTAATNANNAVNTLTTTVNNKMSSVDTEISNIKKSFGNMAYVSYTVLSTI